MDRNKTADPELPIIDLNDILPTARPRVVAPSTDASAAKECSPGMPVAGDVIGGKYRVDGVVGRGGMSVVYRATHLELDQEVALKVLSAAALVLPEYVVRLKREARAASRIRSEHVVRVRDVGELPGTRVPYLVMEHLSGADLAAVLVRCGTVSVALAAECVLQACDALAEAHALGIVHRDLKPANLFLTRSVDDAPCIKVLDFGISRMTRREGLSPLTDPGTVLGTPSYMAPEQMEASDRVDARSDIWALGTILYELLVGHPPYAGESLPQIFMKIMRSRPPRPSAVRSEVPPALDAVVAKCLAIDPKDRFQSVADLAWALSSFGGSRSRERAERISRVLDRRRIETPVTLASATVRRPGSKRRRRERGFESRGRGILVTSAIGILLLAAGVTLGGIVASRVVDRPSLVESAASELRVAQGAVEQEEAISIAPSHRRALSNDEASLTTPHGRGPLVAPAASPRRRSPATVDAGSATGSPATGIFATPRKESLAAMPE
ncbi:Serine/threonine protein kinase PrkC, regulator of stationary phase [Labilithrix luteola]|uniref:Serine/threonine protein kinase PrkC, regulator of stationary phase n=1 Tax=Labilithrix luteola TaxID=1391654 RepID=A0A0K1PKF0_9BACT|nr:serine/threonine-protein kinase [Labilithrix luteola]AKU93997.1 Serine/threonine protein kinase PrkC, regulator of stationary phase [Labilithrix luteola]